MMNRRFLIIPVLIFAAAFCFAQEEPAEAEDLYYEDDWTEDADEVTEDWAEEPEEDGYAEVPWEQPAEQSAEVVIPRSIQDNEYFLKSVELNELAKEAFEEGDYDASVAYAEEAAEYARLSDEYVAMRLAESVFARAHSRYTWAGSVGAERRYPANYRTATAAYNEALNARKAEHWADTTAAANRVLAALSNVKGYGSDTGPSAEQLWLVVSTLPARYTVRHWRETGDCFSAIAGWSWVYGDPSLWRKLYEANREKLPNPDNPNLILPGMIIIIPSLKGEARSGMWDPSAKYSK